MISAVRIQEEQQNFLFTTKTVSMHRPFPPVGLAGLDGIVLQPGVERADGREAQRHERDPHLASGARTGMDRGGRGTAVSLENVSSATQL